MIFKIAMFFLLPLAFCCSLWAEESLMMIENASIQKISGNRFRITVNGQAQTAGWEVSARQAKEQGSDNHRKMEIVGQRKDDFAAQMITPYTYNFDSVLPMETKKITLVGSNQELILNIPWLQNLMMIDKADIKKVSDSRFLISVSGNAPTPGWEVTLQKHRYEKPPANMFVDVAGTGPDGFVIQVLTPYNYSQELELAPEVKKVTLCGSDRQIVLDIPRTTKPMIIEKAEISKIDENRYMITVSGKAPTPGWKISATPRHYIAAPDDWEIDISGIPPSGMVIQMISPFTHKFEFTCSDPTKKVSLVGSNQTVSLNLPK